MWIFEVPPEGRSLVSIVVQSYGILFWTTWTQIVLSDRLRNNLTYCFWINKLISWNEIFNHSTWQNLKIHVFIYHYHYSMCVFALSTTVLTKICYLWTPRLRSLTTDQHEKGLFWKSYTRVFHPALFFFLFTAPLTNDLFAKTEGQWGGDIAIASDIGAVNMTALDGAGGGWAATAITLLSGCCNMILGHISSGFQPPFAK